MKQLVPMLIIGFCYWMDWISKTAAVIILVVIFVSEYLEAQQEKIEELSDKIDELSSSRNDTYFETLAENYRDKEIL